MTSGTRLLQFGAREDPASARVRRHRCSLLVVHARDPHARTGRRRRKSVEHDRHRCTAPLRGAEQSEVRRVRVAGTLHQAHANVACLTRQRAEVDRPFRRASGAERHAPGRCRGQIRWMRGADVELFGGCDRSPRVEGRQVGELPRVETSPKQHVQRRRWTAVEAAERHYPHQAAVGHGAQRLRAEPALERERDTRGGEPLRELAPADGHRSIIVWTGRAGRVVDAALRRPRCRRWSRGSATAPATTRSAW